MKLRTSLLIVLSSLAINVPIVAVGALVFGDESYNVPRWFTFACQIPIVLLASWPAMLAIDRIERHLDRKKYADAEVGTDEWYDGFVSGHNHEDFT